MLRHKQINKRTRPSRLGMRLLTAFFGVVFAASFIIPALLNPQAAHADPAPSIISLLKQGTDQSKATYGDLIACKANTAIRNVDQAFLVSVFGDYLGTKIVEAQRNNSFDQVSVEIGASNSTASPAFASNNEITPSVLRYIGGTLNKPVSILAFAPSGATDNNPSGDYRSVPTNSADCNKFVLFPISATEYRASQLVTQGFAGGSVSYVPISFKNPVANGGTTQGQLGYAYFNQSSGQVAFQKFNGFTATGNMSSVGGGGGGGGTTTTVGDVPLSGVWDDIHQIRLSNGDVYQKWQWDKYNEYFLVSTTRQDHQQYIWSAAKNKNLQPYTDGSDKTIQGQFCVPFLYIPNLDINLSDVNDSGASTLNAHIAAAASRTAELYDVATPPPTDTTDECVPVNGGNRLPVALSASVQGSNEEQFNGEYTFDSSANAYRGPTTASNGASGCATKSLLEPQNSPQGQTFFNAVWTLAKKSDSCALIPTKINVAVQSVDQATYDGVKVPTDVNADQTDDKIKVSCDVNWNPLTWIICPLVDLAVRFANGLTSEIEVQLDTSTNGIDTSLNESDPTNNTGRSMYSIWSTIRNMALSLLVLIALIMVISQAIDFGPFDAYTVKKVLPRILIAVIAVSLAWPVLKFIIGISNDAGVSVKTIINRAFAGSDQYGVIQLDATSVGTAGAIGIGAGLTALGALGTLSFVVTAAVALIVGFAVIVFRNLLVVFLVLISPLAIIAWILPNTQKMWKFWYDNLLAALLAFPIIVGIIYLGRAFAVVAAPATSRNFPLIQSIVQLICYFGPFFLLPLAFRLAGGAIASIGGMVNDRSRGILDRTKKMRQNETAKNMQRLKAGSRFEGNTPGTRGLAKAFNRTTAGVGTGWKGRFGTGARGRAALDQASRAAATEQIMKGPHWSAINQNDDALMAATYGNAKEASAALRAKGWSDERINKANAAVQASIGFGRPQAIAAAQQLVSTGTGYKAYKNARGENVSALEEMASTLARASGGNAGTAMSLAGFANSETKRTGRFDLAPGFGNLSTLVNKEAGLPVSADKARYGYDAALQDSWSSADLNTMVRGKDDSQTQYFLSHWSNKLRHGNADERKQAAIAMAEFQTSLPSATAGNQKRINDTLAEIGIDHNDTAYKQAVSAQLEQQYQAEVASGKADAKRDPRAGHPEMVAGRTIEGQLSAMLSDPTLVRGTDPALRGPAVSMSEVELRGRERAYDNSVPRGERGGGAGAGAPDDK
jgi:hypothetical protein